jgi:acyl-homoserine-lactone acylase
MALSCTEGSTGSDIERVNLSQLEAFYDKTANRGVAALDPRFSEPSGSNGAAIAPSNTAGKPALLLINPHTSFFFRSELQMVSDEGLNAYGASTWGQFFIYQGFNERAGWMHTSSGVDAVDEFVETVEKRGDGFVYKMAARRGPLRRPKSPFRIGRGWIGGEEVHGNIALTMGRSFARRTANGSPSG